MKCKALKTIVVLAGLACHSNLAIAGTILLNTIDNLPTDSAKSVNSSSAGQSFMADSTGNIGEVELYLSNTNPTATGSVVITIYNDVSNTIGSLVDTIETLPQSAIPKLKTLFDFYNITLATSLTPGSTYFLVVTRSAAGSTSSVYTDTTTPSVGTGTLYALGGNASSSSPYLALCLSSDNSCDGNSPGALKSFNLSSAVPEPTSLAIVGAGIVGLGWVRRRQSQKAR